jgi:hypothetical protein
LGALSAYRLEQVEHFLVLDPNAYFCENPQGISVYGFNLLPVQKTGKLHSMPG